MSARAVTLFSGSSGNSLFVESDGTSLLVDAGVCCRSIESALAAIDADPRRLSGILVTHEHSDHVAGVGVMMRRYRTPLYVNKETWRIMSRSIGKVDPQLINFITLANTIKLGEIEFSSFRTPHDAVQSVGYRIETSSGAVSVMTDIGTMTEQLQNAVAGSSVMFIESNYDPLMLEHGAYPRHLKSRITSDHGHLSNDDCGKAIANLARLGTVRFVLSHLSKENNYPALAYDTVSRRLQEFGIDARRDLEIQVARRQTPGDLIYL
ncbi:MAG: MBL fold metallo-hydrolase [Ruminococcaceae bacterium]|nr:MBL fold metallo-hydrolase [Oscillospiraceae bacterium]